MPTYTGQSAIGGPERTNLHAHVFPGGRSDLVKKVASVSALVSIEKKHGKSGVKLTALVRNVGSGHFMPTGLPGLREMWVEAEVHDSRGNSVFTGRSPIGKVALDKQGNPTMPWNAVRFGKDTRIGPMGKSEPAWNFPLPESNREPLLVKVAVFYRSISALAAQAGGMEPSRPIEIASDRLRLFPDGSFERIAVE